MDETRRRCELILDILGDAHEYFIEEALPDSRQAKERLWARWIPLAACCALALTAVLFFSINGIGDGLHGKVPGETPPMTDDRSTETEGTYGTDDMVVSDETGMPDDGDTAPPATEMTEHITEAEFGGIDIMVCWYELRGYTVGIEEIYYASSVDENRWSIASGPDGEVSIGGKKYEIYGDTVFLRTDRDGDYYVAFDYKTGEINDFIAKLPAWESIRNNNNEIIFCNGYESASYLVIYNADGGNYLYVYSETEKEWIDIAATEKVTTDYDDATFFVMPPDDTNWGFSFLVTVPAHDKAVGISEVKGRYSINITSYGNSVQSYNLTAHWFDDIEPDGQVHYMRLIHGLASDGGDCYLIWTQCDWLVISASVLNKGNELYEVFPFIGVPELYESVMVCEVGDEFDEASENRAMIVDVNTGEITDPLESVRDRIDRLRGDIYMVEYWGTEAMFDGVNSDGADDSFYVDFNNGVCLVISDLLADVPIDRDGVSYKGRISYGLTLGGDSYVEGIAISVYKNGSEDPFVKYFYDFPDGGLSVIDPSDE